MTPTNTSLANQPIATTTMLTWSAALRFWAWLGCVSFGGPAGQIGIMHQEVVERKRWVSERQFMHALNYCMLLPGPEAQQLATYLGWLLHGFWGGVFAGTLFILPGFVLLVALSWISMTWGEIAWVRAILVGFQPAVIAVILAALHRMTKKNLRGPVAIGLAIGALLALLAGVAFGWILLAAGLIGLVCHVPGAGHGSSSSGNHDQQTPDILTRNRSWQADLCRSLLIAVGFLLLGASSYVAMYYLHGSEHITTLMAEFFTKAALLTFGGAYAVLPYVTQYAEQMHWATSDQVLTGLALGETTPGPLILVITYIAFVGGWQDHAPGNAVGGIVCACVATWFTFLPSFAFILVGAPWVERLRAVRWLTWVLNGISAAVVGVIAHLGVQLLLHVWWPGIASKPAEIIRTIWQDPATISNWQWPSVWPVLVSCLAAAALIIGKQSVPRVVLACGCLGLFKWLLLG